MKTKFGVHSETPANQKLKNGYTLYDWVMRQHKFPAFWGRGLSALSADEVTFLREKACKILPVADTLTELQVSRSNGQEDALQAVEAAKALGIPQNRTVALFALIQPDWSVNHNWMISFAQTLWDNGYIPGFMGNTDSSKNFNFDRQCSHFVQATADAHQFGAIYGATEPKCEGSPAAWAPYCPSALNPQHIGLWMRSTATFDTLEIDDVYARDENALAILW